jgi:hypothetical protein
MRAIRIIRSSSFAETGSSDVSAIDRAEMVEFIAQRIAEASGSPESVNECAKKLRDMNLTLEETDDLMLAVDQGLHTAMTPMSVHSELDLTRIFSLLED